MKYAKRMVGALAVAFVATILVPAAMGQAATEDGPETVMATYRVKPAQIDAFLKMMPEYWAALRERNMVVPAPHVLLRGEENGKPIVVEVLSWRQHGIPDDVPPAIQAYWDKMNTMVEARDGHKGIEFPEMTIVPVKDRARNKTILSAIMNDMVMPDTGNGIASQRSQHTVDETVERLKKILEAKGVMLFALVDHSGEAEKAGLSMPPTKLLIFGNPAAGTPVMLAAPSIALDLPLKILVSEDAEGVVWLSWNSPEYLQQRHGVPQELVKNIGVGAALAAKAGEP